jgi:hypothetical protein
LVGCLSVAATFVGVALAAVTGLAATFATGVFTAPVFGAALGPALLAAAAFGAAVFTADAFATVALPAGFRAAAFVVAVAFAVAVFAVAALAAVGFTDGLLVGALDAAFTGSRVGVFNATVRILLAPAPPVSSAAW